MLYGLASETLAQSENKFELILTIIVDQQTIKAFPLRENNYARK